MDDKKQVKFSRTLNAPREKVWKAWTDPAQVAKWWGPNDVGIPECEMDLRVGGRIRIVMEAGEAMGPYKGTRWPMEGTFTAVEPNTKLAYEVKAWTEGAGEATEIDQLHELTLADEGGKTKMELTVTVRKVGPGAKMAIQGMQMGFSQQFDKLERFLA
ncbi:MAG TPA: SRPBCC domain-containing protein [Candidatus Paceibacterota bacterium]|nr:SRPBCC domain-containing protein [Candidatus Paceibacterota bacterium]